MRPTSLHSNFFSSLKQVEKRLKLESPTQPFNLPHVGTNDTSTESLNFDKGNHEKESFCDDSCRCEGGFYEKIVGAKGPKCKKEVERLEEWIRYYLQDGGGEEKREPLRLAFLLLGKANFESENGDGASFGGLDIEFPSAIEEFLKYDPPRESN
ncbi:hypothetical protein GH714_004895 [Hevea brasiliensis]|uniref:Uncharacterized protein n=1 Tax=Hevea brasiliensis TaxID=3981 RepID=A0A6A6LV99_HEVBR|nr:hypothetical protein GH714_004895 [Hevea brasiliensis]